MVSRDCFPYVLGVLLGHKAVTEKLEQSRYTIKTFTIMKMTNQMLENAQVTPLSAEECANTLGGSSETWTFKGSDGNYYTATRTESGGSVSLSVRPATAMEQFIAVVTSVLE